MTIRFHGHSILSNLELVLVEEDHLSSEHQSHATNNPDVTTFLVANRPLHHAIEKQMRNYWVMENAESRNLRCDYY